MIAYAHGTDENTSVVREGIEHAEERVLGSENHAQLEKVEPKIDTFIPFVLTGISLILFGLALYLRFKKRK